jgi:hypothetical protein
VDTIARQTSAEFRHKVSTELLPRLEAFKPDILFLSAGFDGHVDDLYHFLTDDDYSWVTRETARLMAATDGPGVVVSVLEGGYSCKGVPEPVERRRSALRKRNHQPQPQSQPQLQVGAGEPQMRAACVDDGFIVSRLSSSSSARRRWRVRRRTRLRCRGPCRRRRGMAASRRESWRTYMRSWTPPTRPESRRSPSLGHHPHPAPTSMRGIKSDFVRRPTERMARLFWSLVRKIQIGEGTLRQSS